MHIGITIQTYISDCYDMNESGPLYKAFSHPYGFHFHGYNTTHVNVTVTKSSYAKWSIYIAMVITHSYQTLVDIDT